jgi:hypothetical protein
MEGAMNAAVLGSLVEQWVWRCQMVVTQYQLRQPIDLKAEVEKLVGQAEVQARLLEATGPIFLAKVESRLDLRAHIAELPAPLVSGKPSDPALNVAGRAEALHVLADAFGDAARRIRSAA